MRLLRITAAEWFFYPVFLIQIADRLQPIIALTVGGLCKGHPTPYNKPALMLVKKNRNNSKAALHSFHSAYELCSSKGHLTFFSAFPASAKMPLSAQMAAGKLPWLSWWPRGSDWLPGESTTLGTGHKYLFPYTLHGAGERRCSCQKGVSLQKKNPEEIRLLGTAKFFMQFSSRISLRCPQILILVMKCSD